MTNWFLFWDSNNWKCNIPRSAKWHEKVEVGILLYRGGVTTCQSWRQNHNQTQVYIFWRLFHRSSIMSMYSLSCIFFTVSSSRPLSCNPGLFLLIQSRTPDPKYYWLWVKNSSQKHLSSASQAALGCWYCSAPVQALVQRLSQTTLPGSSQPVVVVAFMTH